MNAIMKNGSIVEIDTSCLFNNQYNTTDGRRIFDQDIKAIQDDARPNMGKCRYCGAMIRRGEEEKHFSEREAQSCTKCFWYRDHVTDRKTETRTEYTTNENGEQTRQTIRTTTETICKQCYYNDSSTASRNRATCSNRECRAYGVEWFTPENTFFLKYPNGFESIPEVDKLESRGFILDKRFIHAMYHKKIGSYNLQAILHYEDGKPEAIDYYMIWNARRNYKFRIENGEIFTDKYSFGFRKVKTLEGIPENVMQAVKNICNH